MGNANLTSVLSTEMYSYYICQQKKAIPYIKSPLKTRCPLLYMVELEYTGCPVPAAPVQVPVADIKSKITN